VTAYQAQRGDARSVAWSRTTRAAATRGFSYLAIALDVCRREIAAYATVAHLRTELVLQHCNADRPTEAEGV